MQFLLDRWDFFYSETFVLSFFFMRLSGLRAVVLTKIEQSP